MLTKKPSFARTAATFISAASLCFVGMTNATAQTQAHDNLSGDAVAIQSTQVQANNDFSADSGPDQSCSHQATAQATPEFVDDATAVEVAEDYLGQIQGAPEVGSPNVVHVEDSVVVSWPLSSNGFSEGSFFSVAMDLDNNYEVLSTGQAQIDVIDESSVELTTWANSEFQSSETISEPDAQLGTLASGPSTTDCIIQATGVAPATAIAIVSACTGLCAVTLGAGCALCVGGFTALGSASIMSCFGAMN